MVKANKMFQFQTGSIKSENNEIDLDDMIISFNSKLVRLKVRGWATVDASDSTKFQFQTGSIKRIIWTIFQRTMVHVSIPNWFD